MTHSHGAQEFHRRQVMSVARKYRREGYSVIIPDRTTEIPDFLGDHVPDLIATSDDDRVVVEIRRATSLRGSNDIVDLAQRIERHPSWRFELIALAGFDVSPISRQNVDETRKEVDKLIHGQFDNAAFIYALAVTERLIASIAVQNNVNPSNATFSRMARHLVTRGLISADHQDAIGEALETRDRLLQSGRSQQATHSEIDKILELNDALADEIHTEAAA